MKIEEFLREKKEKEFKEVVNRLRELKVYRAVDYSKVAKENDTLPEDPKEFFKDIWESKNGWKGLITLTNPNIKNYYPTFVEWQEATKKINITNSLEYIVNRNKDSLLHVDPKEVYKGFDSWENALPLYEKPARNPTVKDPYKTLKEVGEATLKLGISTVNEYKMKRHLDPRLVSNPSMTYENEWKHNGGWRTAMPLSYRGVEFYEKFKEASKAVIELEIKTTTEYAKRYKEDPRLPSNPNAFFGEIYSQMGGWKSFSGQMDEENTLDFQVSYYGSLKEVINSAKNKNVKDSFDFEELRKEDPKIPEDLEKHYPSEIKKIGGLDCLIKKIKEKSSTSMKQKI